MDISERIVISDGSNIRDLRMRCPGGLHFVVGDTHGEAATLTELMNVIDFDPGKDHVYFTGDYNGGGSVQSLLEYMAFYFQPDYSLPGFHMIRGNHERELCPIYMLENLPDILVLRGNAKNYYIVHAGMVAPAFDLINEDMARYPDQRVFAYRLDSALVQYDGPLRQLIWSRNGLYSQRSRWHSWPSEENLARNKACILHGHSPYCFFKMHNYLSYGDQNLFWKNQRIFFSEDLQSFNLDSNVKGRHANGESRRGLACVCLEGIEEIAAQNQGHLSVEAVKNAPNFVFSADLSYNRLALRGDIRCITDSAPETRRITVDPAGALVIAG